MPVMQMCGKMVRRDLAGPTLCKGHEYIAVVRQHQATVIQTVQETEEIHQRSKFDRVAVVAVSQQRQTAEHKLAFARTQLLVSRRWCSRCWRKCCVLVKGTIRTDQPVVDRMQSRSTQQTSSSMVVKPGGEMNLRSRVHECRLRCERQ